MHTVESNKLMVKLLFCTHTYISTAVYFCCLFVDLFINFTTKTFHKKKKFDVENVKVDFEHMSLNGQKWKW